MGNTRKLEETICHGNGEAVEQDNHKREIDRGAGLMKYIERQQRLFTHMHACTHPHTHTHTHMHMHTCKCTLLFLLSILIESLLLQLIYLFFLQKNTMSMIHEHIHTPMHMQKNTCTM